MQPAKHAAFSTRQIQRINTIANPKFIQIIPTTDPNRVITSPWIGNHHRIDTTNILNSVIARTAVYVRNLVNHANQRDVITSSITIDLTSPGCLLNTYQIITSTTNDAKTPHSHTHQGVITFTAVYSEIPFIIILTIKSITPCTPHQNIITSPDVTILIIPISTEIFKNFSHTQSFCLVLIKDGQPTPTAKLIGINNTNQQMHMTWIQLVAVDYPNYQYQNKATSHPHEMDRPTAENVIQRKPSPPSPPAPTTSARTSRTNATRTLSPPLPQQTRGPHS